MLERSTALFTNTDGFAFASRAAILTVCAISRDKVLAFSTRLREFRTMLLPTIRAIFSIRWSRNSTKWAKVFLFSCSHADRGAKFAKFRVARIRVIFFPAIRTRLDNQAAFPIGIFFPPVSLPIRDGHAFLATIKFLRGMARFDVKPFAAYQTRFVHSNMISGNPLNK